MAWHRPLAQARCASATRSVHAVLRVRRVVLQGADAERARRPRSARPCYIVARLIAGAGSPHEKPLSVMRELVRIAEPSGLVLDPFAGSATTGVAAVLEGRRFLGFELSEEYLRIGRGRLRAIDAQANRGSKRIGRDSRFATEAGV